MPQELIYILIGVFFLVLIGMFAPVAFLIKANKESREAEVHEQD